MNCYVSHQIANTKDHNTKYQSRGAIKIYINLVPYVLVHFCYCTLLKPIISEGDHRHHRTIQSRETKYPSIFYATLPVHI